MLLCFHWCQIICVLCVSSLLLFGCQYHCNKMPGKTRLQNDLLCVICVEWDIKPYTVTHSSVDWPTYDTLLVNVNPSLEMSVLLVAVL